MSLLRVPRSRAAIAAIRTVQLLVAASTSSMAPVAYAQALPGAEKQAHQGQAGAPSGQAGAPSGTAGPAVMADGEVRKVDKEQGKLTLRHGPIQGLDMPAMTMVFRVADPKMLDSVKTGDKVRFAADRVNGTMTVTAMEPAAK